MEQTVYEFQRRSPHKAKRRTPSKRYRGIKPLKLRVIPVVILCILSSVLGGVVGLSTQATPAQEEVVVPTPTPQVITQYIQEQMTDEEIVNRALELLPEHIFRPQYEGVTFEGLSEKPIPVYPWTEIELRVFANLLWYEARGEEYRVIKKCASVVVNRLLDEGNDFPDDLIGVIYQTVGNTYQFSPAANCDLYSETLEISQECWDAAEYILTYGSELPEEVMVFYASSMLGTKNWVTSRTIYEQDGQTVFAFLRY